MLWPIITRVQWNSLRMNTPVKEEELLFQARWRRGVLPYSLISGAWGGTAVITVLSTPCGRCRHGSECCFPQLPKAMHVIFHLVHPWERSHLLLCWWRPHIPSLLVKEPHTPPAQPLAPDPYLPCCPSCWPSCCLPTPPLCPLSSPASLPRLRATFHFKMLIFQSLLFWWKL